MLSGDFPLSANPASCSGMRTWHAQPSVTPRAPPALGPSSFAFISLAQSHHFGEAGFGGWEQRPSPATQRCDPFSPAPPRAAAPRDAPLLWTRSRQFCQGPQLRGWDLVIQTSPLTCLRHQSYFLLHRGPRHQGALSLSAGSAAGGGRGSGGGPALCPPRQPVGRTRGLRCLSGTFVPCRVSFSALCRNEKLS